MIMNWSEKTWEKSFPIYEKIISHPFIHGLINGTLPRDKFCFYIQQDALYLKEYGKIMSGLASRLDDVWHSNAFRKFAIDTVEVEKALHANFREKFNIPAGAVMSPSCRMYISFMHNILLSRPVYEAVAAVLPCFTVYMHVGNHIYANQTQESNPYKDWIDTYSGDSFAESVKTAEDICDELALNCSSSQRKKMLEHYLFATKLEWMFWNSAYEMEQWKI